MMPRKNKALAADDDFIGTRVADTFWLPQGHSTVSGFNPEQDRVGLDLGGYSDIQKIGAFADGEVFTTFAGTQITFSVVDANQDGVPDTHIEATGIRGSTTVDILGVLPSDLHGWNLVGG